MRFTRTALRLTIVTAISVTGMAGVSGSAGAAPAPKPTAAQVVGTVTIDPNDPTVGYIHARYVCTGEGALWVSVKQTADRTADPALAEEGSSQISAAWSDSHRNAVTCNGKWQNDTFRVDQLEPYFTDEGPQGPKSDIYDPLAKGEGWVQFCLFDDTTPAEPVTSMVFAHVR